MTSLEIGDVARVTKPFQGTDKDDWEFVKGQVVNILSFPDRDGNVKASPSEKLSEKGSIPVSHLIKISEKEKDRLVKEEKKERERLQKEQKKREEKEKKEKLKEEKEKRKTEGNDSRKPRGTFLSNLFSSKGSIESNLEISDPNSVKRFSIDESLTKENSIESSELGVSKTLRSRKSVFWKGKNAPAVFKNVGDPDQLEDKFLQRPSREAMIKKGIIKEDDSLVKKLFKKGNNFFSNLQSGGWEQNKETIVPSNSVFGKPLGPQVLKDNKYTIPSHVVNIIKELDRAGIKEEGIYRLSGGTAEINKLKECIGRNEPIDLKTLNRHTLGSVLKQWFRELPEPLCTFNLYSKFMKSNNIPKLKLKVETLIEAIVSLPTENFIVFAWLIVYLGTVSNFQNRNKMDANNLGVVFGPTLISCSESDPNFDPFEQMRTCEPIRLAIEARDTLFPNFNLEKTSYTLEEIQKMKEITVPEEIVLAEPPVTTGLKISISANSSNSSISKLSNSATVVVPSQTSPLKGSNIESKESLITKKLSTGSNNESNENLSRLSKKLSTGSNNESNDNLSKLSKKLSNEVEKSGSRKNSKESSEKSDSRKDSQEKVEKSGSRKNSKESSEKSDSRKDSQEKVEKSGSRKNSKESSEKSDSRKDSQEKVLSQESLEKKQKKSKSDKKEKKSKSEKKEKKSKSEKKEKKSK